MKIQTEVDDLGFLVTMGTICAQKHMPAIIELKKAYHVAKRSKLSRRT